MLSWSVLGSVVASADAASVGVGSCAVCWSDSARVDAAVGAAVDAALSVSEVSELPQAAATRPNASAIAKAAANPLVR